MLAAHTMARGVGADHGGPHPAATGQDGDPRGQLLAGDQQLECRIGPAPDDHQVPVGEPAAQYTHVIPTGVRWQAKSEA